MHVHAYVQCSSVQPGLTFWYVLATWCYHVTVDSDTDRSYDGLVVSVCLCLCLCLRLCLPVSVPVSVSTVCPYMSEAETTSSGHCILCDCFALDRLVLYSCCSDLRLENTNME